MISGHFWWLFFSTLIWTWREQRHRLKTFLRILEHVGQLLCKFQVARVTRSRDLACEKWKNLEKPYENQWFSDETLNKFIKEIVDFEIFSFFHTRDLEIYITNPPETCTGVVSHALVCAKKIWGTVLTSFMFKSII